MYETLEFYDSNGFDLKEVLKSCIFNYYMNQKKEKNDKKDLQFRKNHRIIEATNKEILSEKKGDSNVL